MKLTKEYKKNGYMKMSLRSFCPPSELSSDYLKERYESGVENYINYLKIKSKSISVQNQFMAGCLLGRLNRLGIETPVIVEQPVLHVMSPSLRIPDGYYGTAAHQDWPSTQGSLDCVTVWIALTDAGVGNFPLEVIPGSHKRGLLDGKMNGSVLEVEADDKEFIPVECKAGDVIFLSGFLVHRTGAGTGFRVAVSQRFDNSAEASFIERGYPCAQRNVSSIET